MRLLAGYQKYIKNITRNPENLTPYMPQPAGVPKKNKETSQVYACEIHNLVTYCTYNLCTSTHPYSKRENVVTEFDIAGTVSFLLTDTS